MDAFSDGPSITFDGLEKSASVMTHSVKSFSLSLAFIIRFKAIRKWPKDLYHTAAMLSLGGIMFLHGKPRTEFSSGRG